jgi:hypothetical protein
MESGGICNCQNKGCSCSKKIEMDVLDKDVSNLKDIKHPKNSYKELYDYLNKLYSSDDKKVQLVYDLLVDEEFHSLRDLEIIKPDLLMSLRDKKTISLGTLNILINDLKNRRSDLNNWNKIARRTEMIRLFLFYGGSVIYIGFCFALLAFNHLIIENTFNGTSDEGQERAFHVTEFSAPFVYTLLIFLVTFKIPRIKNKRINTEYIVDSVRLVAILLECTTTIIGALLIYYAQEDFEKIAHYLDYTSLLLLTLVDLAILFTSNDKFWKRLLSLILIIISLGGIIAMFILQSQDKDFPSHYVEFSIEIVLVLGTMIAISVQKR